MENQIGKKPRILCLHGHGSNAKILQQNMKAWPEFLLEMMDLVYIDAPFLIQTEGKSDPPHYEWFHANENFTVYEGFDEGIAYIEEKMIILGPFDGVLGFSQGAIVTAALPGMQREGVALTRVPRIKFVIVISGAKLGGKKMAAPELAKNAFSSPIDIPSLHITGEYDVARESQFELIQSFVHPIMLYHHQGHVIPYLNDNGIKIVLTFLHQIQRILQDNVGNDKICCSCSFWNLISGLYFGSIRGTKLRGARVQNLTT